MSLQYKIQASTLCTGSVTSLLIVQSQCHFLKPSPGAYLWRLKIGLTNNDFSGEQFCIHEKPTVVKLGNSHFGFIPFKKDKKMGETIAEIQNEIDGKDWILISHGDFYAGSKKQNPLEPGEYMPLTRNDLSRYKPKLTFLGHIHKPQLLENSIYYLGSPCGLDITETGKRRFLILDTNNFSKAITSLCSSSTASAVNLTEPLSGNLPLYNFPIVNLFFIAILTPIVEMGGFEPPS